jgi:hypothetical protein
MQDLGGMRIRQLLTSLVATGALTWAVVTGKMGTRILILFLLRFKLRWSTAKKERVLSLEIAYLNTAIRTFVSLGHDNIVGLSHYQETDAF